MDYHPHKVYEDCFHDCPSPTIEQLNDARRLARHLLKYTPQDTKAKYIKDYYWL